MKFSNTTNWINKFKNYCHDLIEKCRNNFNVGLLILIASYLFFALFTMAALISGITETIILCFVGSLYILIYNPWKTCKLKLNKSAFITLGITIYLGYSFYDRWMLSSKVRTIASQLKLSPKLIIITTAVFFSIVSVYFIFSAIQLLLNKLTTATPQRSNKDNIFYSYIVAVATIFSAQIMVSVDLLSMGLTKAIIGSIVVLLVSLTLYCFCKSIIVSTLLGSGVFMLISTINTYVFLFRDRLFAPVDIFTTKTAINVLENYSLFPVPLQIIIGWIIWLSVSGYMIYACVKRNKCQPFSRKNRLFTIFCCLLGLVFCLLYTTTLKSYHWEKEGALYNGYILDFVSKFKEIRLPKPEGYSKDRIEELEKQYQSNSTTTGNQTDVPHIIVIMDEAFSDLNAIGEIQTSAEVTPFISSLNQNTITGSTLVSAFGGNTANSEFEFLTGSSMAWFPQNTIPYQQYINSPAYSMVSYLKASHSYYCVSMHPFLSTGWNRPVVYSYLGFNESLFIEDFPQKDYIRQYISDQEMFEKIIDVYENCNDAPLFLFGVSMQNHGGYSYTGDHYQQSISYTGTNKYFRVDQYLSLIHETDKAVEYLISYFSNVDEKVVIVFYGDHQPKLDEAFYNDILTDGFDSLDNQQKKYTVPFFIWANYDIQEKHVEQTSLNYLSSYVYEVAGIQLPIYNLFLKELEHTIPSINANGYYSLSRNSYLPFDKAADKEKYWLQLYQILQYNSIVDTQNRSRKFFPIIE